MRLEKNYLNPIPDSARRANAETTSRSSRAMTKPAALTSDKRAEVLAAVELWARWRRDRGHEPQGYPRRTLESRLVDEGGVLIAGQGLKLETPADCVECVEQALLVMDESYRLVLEGKWLRRWTDAYTAHKLGASVSTMRRFLDCAYDAVGRLL